MEDFPPQGTGPSNHNDLLNRDVVAAHPAEAVGVLSPYSKHVLEVGTKWKDMGAFLDSGFSSDWVIYLGGGILLAANTLTGAVIRSTDYGSHWFDVGVVSASWIRSFSASDGVVIATDDAGHVFRSIDFGLTWTDIGVIVAPANGIPASQYVGRGIFLIFDENMHVQRSTDYGVTWNDLGVVSLSSFVKVSAYLDNGIVLAGDNAGNAYRSTDYGATWSTVNIGATTYITALSYIIDGIVLAGSNGGHIFRSTDYGVTWTDLGAIASTFIEAPHYIGNGIVIAVDNDGHVFKSTDYGATWTDLGVIAAGTWFTSSCYLSSGTLVAFTNSGHVFKSDIPYLHELSQANFPRKRVDLTASRALNTTYTNSDPTRTLHVEATVRCAITLAGGNAYVQGKAEVTAGVPAAVASGIVGIEAGLLNEDNSPQVSFYVMPGEKYRIDSSVANGTTTLGKWFETYL